VLQTKSHQSRVLIVDDDPFTVEMVRDALEGEGFLAPSASSGEEALCIMGEGKVDLILLDIMMPAMDGFELFQLIKEKEDWRHIPVIFISAKSSVNEKLFGLKLGAEDYLVKPVSADEVLAKVKLWLRVKEAEGALWERNRELSALLESSGLLTSSLDLSETLRRIIQVAQALLPSVCANLMLLNERDELIVSAHANFPQEWLEDLQRHPLKVGESLAGWVAQRREVLCVPDPLSNAPNHYRSAPFAEKFGIVSYLGIPLTVGERLIGVLSFNSFKDRTFTPEQIALISAFGQHAAIAIDNAQAYAQIRAAEEYLSNLVENSQDAIISLDLKGIIRLWNQGAERIYGHGAQEMVGRSIEVIVPDHSRQELQERLRRIGSEGSPEVFQGKRQCKDGRVTPVLATWSLIRDEEGRPRAISLIEKDVSELYRMEDTIRESRKKLWGVIDGITDFLYVVDKDHRICQINRAYATYLRQSPQSVVGRICYESLRGQGEPCPDCMLGEVLEKGGLVRSEREEMASDGQARIWEVSAFPVLMGSGEVIQVIHQLKDISEKKWMESQMLRQEKLASLGELAAGVAHEINNPLASLSIYNELLRRKQGLDEEAQKYIWAMEENADRIAKIVRGLLDFSRPASRDLRPLYLQEVIKNSLGILERHSLFRDIEIDCEVSEDLPPVRGDHLELEQVFLNLILNASQSMPKGGHLWIKAKPAQGSFLEVSVRDTGSGISPKLLPRIFDPFFTTKPAGKGTGLGLSVVRRIIENYQGRIWVESELEKGSTFTFTLPICQESEWKEKMDAFEEDSR